MSLLSDLMAAPQKSTAPSRYTTFCGIFYMANGLLILAWPGVVQTLFRDEAFVGNESMLFRVIGMLLTIVGWFYFFGGRTGSRSFVVSTVIDRIILVPAVLIPVALACVFPHVLLTFGILDPILGFIGWYLLASDKS